MKVIEPPKKARARLLTEEQTSSGLYVVLRLGLAFAAVGTLGFVLPFLTRTTLTNMGIQWKDLQTYALLLVFAGVVLFVLAAAYFKIDVGGMTFDRLLSIVRNEVYVPPDEQEHLRRFVKSALSSLDDRWSLYPGIQLEKTGHQLPFAIVGPPGVFGLDLNTADPRKRGYVDPAARLVSDCGVLQARLSSKVTPILLLARHASKYTATHPRLKAFSAEQLVAWFGTRPATLTSAGHQSVDRFLRDHQTRAAA